jgi:molybdenum cofactor biosynthesis enzyme MoaA
VHVLHAGRGAGLAPRSELLTFEELTRLLRSSSGLGVRSLKVTGGEPTVRADLPNLIRMFRRAGPELDISITTNGLLLERLAAPLAEAGVDRATVSCDSLLRHRFAEMTRRDALDRVLAGLAAAEAAGLTPIKINTVVIAGPMTMKSSTSRGGRAIPATRSGSSNTCRSMPSMHGSGRRSSRRLGSWRRSTGRIRSRA